MFGFFTAERYSMALTINSSLPLTAQRTMEMGLEGISPRVSQISSLALLLANSPLNDMGIAAKGREFENQSIACEITPSGDYSLNYSENICRLKKDGNLPRDGVVDRSLTDPKSFYAPRNTIPKDRTAATANAAHSVEKLKIAFGEEMANRILKEGKIDPRSAELRKVVDLVDLRYFNPRQVLLLLNMMGDTPAANGIYYGVENKKANPEKNTFGPDCIRTSFTLASMFGGEPRQFDLSNVYHNLPPGADKVLDAERAAFVSQHKRVLDGLKMLFKDKPRETAYDIPTGIDDTLERLLTFRKVNYVPVSMHALVPADSSGKANFRTPQGGFIYRPGDVIDIPMPKPVYPDDPRRTEDGPVKAQRVAKSMGYDTGPQTGLATPGFHTMVVVGVNAKTGEPLLWSIDGANGHAPGNVVPLSFLTKTTVAASSKAIVLRNSDLRPRGLGSGSVPDL